MSDLPASTKDWFIKRNYVPTSCTQELPFLQEQHGHARKPCWSCDHIRHRCGGEAKRPDKLQTTSEFTLSAQRSRERL